MKLTMKFGVILVSLSTLMLQGCMVAAVGAGVGAVKLANAKKLEAKVKCNDSYNVYQKQMIQSNRKPIPLDEYCKI